MEYIKMIRKFIGHNPLILCTCGCLIFNEENRILLQRRTDNGLCGNPGGLMDLGETIYETVIREIKEETGLDIKKENLKIFNIYSGEEQHYIYPNDDEVYFVNIIFEIYKYSGMIAKNDESYELKFFDIDNLPLNVTKSFKCVAKDLQFKANNNK